MQSSSPDTTQRNTTRASPQSPPAEEEIQTPAENPDEWHMPKPDLMLPLKVMQLFECSRKGAVLSLNDPIPIGNGQNKDYQQQTVH